MNSDDPRLPTPNAAGPGGLPAHDDPHEVEPPGASPAAISAGHEEDKFGLTAILYVPLAVVVSLGITYVTVTVLVGATVNPDRRTANDVVARADLNARVINERFGDISSVNEAAPVKQPRLEYLRKTETDGESILTKPPSVRSKLPLPVQDGNSPEIYPEDLRASRYVDAVTGERTLLEYKKLPGDKGLARIPIAEAMKVVAAGNLLPVRKDPVPPAATSDVRAKLSNAGRGGLVEPVADAPGKSAHKHDHDHDEKKKNGDKKSEPEKKQ